MPGRPCARARRAQLLQPRPALRRLGFGRAVRLPNRPPIARNARPASAFDYEHQADDDQAYLDQTRRAIELYQAFIERAGNDPEYRAAVKRSREQIEDLTSARIFVEDGLRSRAKTAK